MKNKMQILNRSQSNEIRISFDEGGPYGNSIGVAPGSSLQVDLHNSVVSGVIKVVVYKIVIRNPEEPELSKITPVEVWSGFIPTQSPGGKVLIVDPESAIVTYDGITIPNTYHKKDDIFGGGNVWLWIFIILFIIVTIVFLVILRPF